MLLPSPLPCDNTNSLVFYRQRASISTPTSKTRPAASSPDLATASCRALQAILGNTPFALSLSTKAASTTITSSPSRSTTPQLRHSLSPPKDLIPHPAKVTAYTPPTQKPLLQPSTLKRRRSSFEADPSSPLLIPSASASASSTSTRSFPSSSSPILSEEDDSSTNQPSTPKRQRRPSPPSTPPRSSRTDHTNNLNRDLHGSRNNSKQCIAEQQSNKYYSEKEDKENQNLNFAELNPNSSSSFHSSLFTENGDAPFNFEFDSTFNPSFPFTFTTPPPLPLPLPLHSPKTTATATATATAVKTTQTQSTALTPFLSRMTLPPRASTRTPLRMGGGNERR